MKHTLILTVLIAALTTVFSSCVKDETEKNFAEHANNSQQSTPLIVYDTINSPISKAIIILDSSFVYCRNNWGAAPTKYTTLKIRNRAGNIIQEWLLENLRTDMFEYHTWKNDPKGLKYGFFYKWEGDLYDLTQDDWDFMMLKTENESGENALGFHLPRHKDINDLKKIVGDNGRVRKHLRLIYGDSYEPIRDDGKDCYNKNEACIWLDPNNNYDEWSAYKGVDPRRQDKCGIVYVWSLNPNTSYRSYTNIEDLCCNIRLVRNLTIDQW